MLDGKKSTFQTMLSGGMRMENISLNVPRGLEYAFMQDCFGVTVEDTSDPHTRTLRTANESVEVRFLLLFILESALKFVCEVFISVSRFW